MTRFRAQQPVTQKEAKGEPPRLALLVGVGEYAHLSKSEQLNGAKMTSRQCRVFSSHGSIQTTTSKPGESRGHGRGDSQGFSGLGGSDQGASSGWPVLRLFFISAANGSQVPDQPYGHPDHDELDGLDENHSSLMMLLNKEAKKISATTKSTPSSTRYARTKSQNPGDPGQFAIPAAGHGADKVRQLSAPRSHPNQASKKCAAHRC